MAPDTQTANADAQGAPKPPPNLRVSDNEDQECDSCVHDQRGKCVLYNNLPVDDEWVCDSYKKGGPDDADEPADEAKRPAPKNLREAEREAYVRVRAHNRRQAGTQGKRNSGQPEAADRVK